MIKCDQTGIQEERNKGIGFVLFDFVQIAAFDSDYLPSQSLMITYHPLFFLIPLFLYSCLPV